MLVCPICNKKLERKDNSYKCEQNHCFDISSQGYVNLLPANKKNSALPGDDKNMVRARYDFLEKDYYKSLSINLAHLADKYSASEPSILDSGCGEGYYTNNVYNALKPKNPAIVGIDISKFAVKYAAKKNADILFAVASAFHLPIEDNSIDILINCFSPLCEQEFLRVLKKNGYFFYVCPAKNHLWELKQIAYENPYYNEEKVVSYDGFNLIETVAVKDNITLNCADDINNLFMMTPYFWKTPRQGRENVNNLYNLTTKIEFNIYIYQKI